MITAGIFIILCIASGLSYFKTRKQRKAIANLKGPFSWPLVGAVLKVLLLSHRNFFRRSSQYLSKYGAFTRCWVFDRLFIPIADLELAEQLLLSDQHIDTGYELMRDWLGDGVLMCSAEQWPQRHQQLAGLFQADNMPHLADLCRQHAAELSLRLEESSKTRQVFDAWQQISPTVLNIMLATTCGLQPLVQPSNMAEDYARAVTELTALYRERFLSLKSANRIIYWFTAPFMRRRQMRLIKRINGHHKQLVAQLKPAPIDSESKSKKEIYVVTHIEQPNSHKSLLDVLLAGASLTDSQIYAELNTFNYFGHLHSSTALCFALVTIARHPAAQQQCYEELLAARADKEDKDWDLPRLPYLEAVLKETMRLYPPQVIVGRHLTADFEYTHAVVGDGVLPKGAEIYINLYELERNEERLPAANLFQPERFLGDSPQKQPLCYSMGPRCCPAQQFSLLLMKSMLAPLLMNFELLPHGDALRLDLRLALGSDNGFQLALKPRNA